eukprot:gene12292-5875_t
MLIGEEYDKLDKQIAEIERQKEIMKKYEFKDDEVIELDIGGSVYNVYHHTISQKINRKDTFFSSLFSGNFEFKKDQEGRVFIDRDGTHFRSVLNYLREGGYTSKFILPDDRLIVDQIKQEFDYYEIPWPQEVSTLKTSEEKKDEFISNLGKLFDSEVSKMKNMISQIVIPPDTVENETISQYVIYDSDSNDVNYSGSVTNAHAPILNISKITV